MYQLQMAYQIYNKYIHPWKESTLEMGGLAEIRHKQLILFYWYLLYAPLFPVRFWFIYILLKYCLFEEEGPQKNWFYSNCLKYFLFKWCSSVVAKEELINFKHIYASNFEAWTQKKLFTGVAITTKYSPFFQRDVALCINTENSKWVNE